MSFVVVASSSAVDDRTPTAAERRHRQQQQQQHTADCGAVRQFARQTMQYENQLPTTKHHGW